MKRLLILAAAIVLLGAGPVLADCFTSSGATGSGETLFFGSSLTVNVPAPSTTCSVTSELVVPDGYYGVFRADTRGSAFLEGNQTATQTLVGTGVYAGQSGSKTVRADFDDNLFFTKYFASGKAVGPSTTLTLDAGVATTGSTSSSDGAGMDFLDLLLGYTTLAQQQGSFNLIGLQQLAVVTHLDETAGLLTGSNQPLEGGNEITLLGGVGSYTLGVAGRYNLAEGFSLLGGASIVNFGVPGGSASGFLGAAALRYVQPGAQEFRLMGEVGAQIAPLGLSFSRHYEDGSLVGTDTTGSGSGVLGSLYAKGGVLWAAGPADDLVFSATLKQGSLGISSFVEDNPDANPNLFAADLSGTSQSVTTVKVGTDWTHKFGQGADLTASLAVGAATGSGASGNVFGVGAVSGAAQTTLFADYGLRVGWELAPGTRVDGFVAGSTGTGIGTHAQVGAQYHMSF